MRKEEMKPRGKCRPENGNFIDLNKKGQALDS